MFNFLHSFKPDPILFSWGFVKIHWYGFLIVIGIVLGTLIGVKLGKYYQVSKELILDLVFWLILGGIIGARLYHVGLEYNYYLNNPVDIFKIWQGGLAIHGGIIGGLLVLVLFAKFASSLSKNFKKNFWLLSSLVVPGLVLAQAIGRWGNYFNQELFGQPTNFSWGIPINITNRPLEYLDYQFFHPTFLYESLGSLIIFLVLISLHVYLIKKRKYNWEIVVIAYLILYSALRFSLEFVRIDPTLTIWGLRFPQIISILLIVISTLLIIPPIRRRITKDNFSSQT